MDDLALGFGAAVRALRVQRGWTQDDLADASGLQPTYVSDIERGERRPGLANQARLAAALGVKLWELMRLAEEGEVPDA